MAGSASLETHPGLDQWIEIAEDERILVHTGKVDIGQRISTALAMIAAEELDVDYDRIDIKRTETGIDPNEGFTAGSMSMMHSGNAVRHAAATARARLLDMAADELGAARDSLEINDGLIQVPGTNQSVSFWELAGGKPFEADVDIDIPVKAPAGHSVVGQTVLAKGMTEIVSGEMEYLHDLHLPGMKFGRLVRPPHYRASLKSLDAGVVERLEASGVSVIRNGSFLAVAAGGEYEAVKAANRLANAAEWDMGDGLPTQELYEALTANERISLPVVEGGAPIEAPVPELADPPAEAAATLSARYEKPYHMHGSIGPSAGCAVFEDGKLTVWTHNQGVYPLRAAIADALEMEPGDVHVRFVPGAGCYGHNGADDAAFDAALCAVAVPGTPILLKWTRDDEHAWEPYGSAMVMELRASIDGDGRIVDWSHESYGDTFMGRPAPGRAGTPAEKLVSTHFMEDPIDWPVPPPTMGAHVGIHRNLEPLYKFPGPRLVKNLVRGLPLRVSALRTLGAFGNTVAIEAFMNELAEAAGIDPVTFRLNHLDDDRAKECITALADMMAAGKAGDGKGLGRGIAFARYKNSAAYCATGAEVEITDGAEVKLTRAWIVCDAGEVVDPHGLIAQLEGGYIQAASWTLYEQVTWDKDGVTSRDWDSYPILRFDNVPEVECRLMERPGMPFLGAGETVAGPAGGAVANAIHDAIGIRLRRMPFNRDAIRAAALA